MVTKKNNGFFFFQIGYYINFVVLFIMFNISELMQ